MTLWLTAGPVDRRAEQRAQPEAIADLLAHPDAHVLPVVGTSSFVFADGDATRAALIPRDRVAWDPTSWVFLGTLDQRPLFAAAAPEGADLSAFGGEVRDLRAVGPSLVREDAAVLSYARAMVYWHAQHGFCGVCGHPTRVEEAGHKRACVNETCGTSHFPRTDAAMIVVVHDGADRCLLARSHRFPPNMYSALAGFLEPGESLEDCVVREVFEEVGVRVTDVRYHSSQPWPFPRSVMIGFHARAESTALVLDETEIEDARWVTREFIRDRAQWKDFFIPPRIAIARHLVDDWAAGKVA